MNRNHVFFSNVWKFQDFEYFYRFHVVNRNDKKCHCMFWTGTLARILRATQIGDLMGPSWALVACQFVEKICIHSQREKLSSAFRESTEKINLIFAHMCTRVSLQLLWFIGISFFLHFFVMNKSNLRRSFLSTSWHWAAFVFETNKLSNNTWRLDVALCRAVI